jgi:preprotein translocase subunit SecD
LFIGLIALIAVASIIYIKYRKVELTVTIILTLMSEIVLILGFAAFFKWQLDLAAVAGILLVIGTGIDHLIIITDEMLNGTRSKNVKGRIKDAMSIVLGAYVTTLAGMLPLFNAGAGLLKGFAFTTIVGVSAGVLIARPAFASVLETLFDTPDE